MIFIWESAWGALIDPCNCGWDEDVWIGGTFFQLFQGYSENEDPEINCGLQEAHKFSIFPSRRSKTLE